MLVLLIELYSQTDWKCHYSWTNNFGQNLVGEYGTLQLELGITYFAATDESNAEHQFAFHASAECRCQRVLFVAQSQCVQKLIGLCLGILALLQQTK